MHDLLLMLVALGATVFGAPSDGPRADAPLPEASGLESEAEVEPGATGTGPPGSVLVVGDSLAVGARPHLEAALPGTRVQTSASIGRETGDGVAEITGRGSLPPVLVLSLGTNDDPSAVSAFSGHVETVLAAAGPGGCVVWPNIVRPPYNGVSYAGYNRALARLAGAHPNLIVLDWVGMAAANPGWIAPDGVHATPEGYAARGQAIAQAVLTGCAGGSAAPLGD